MNKFFSSIFGLLTVVAPLVSEIRAETFEFLSYAPPRGWVVQQIEGGIAYRRAEGIGLITFYASRPANASHADEFAGLWRERVAPILPGDAPQPQFERDGDDVAAVGGRVVNAKEGLTAISLVAFVARGRVIGALTLATGDDAIREVNAFFDTVKFTPATKATIVSPNADQVSTSEIEVDFAAPPGYTAKRDGRMIVLTPAAISEKTPCIYGISPARPSKGSLEADARAALVEPVPGWQIKDTGFSAMRGTAGAGWKYFWFRALIYNPGAGNNQAAYAMAMAFPSGEAGRVNIVWGFGPIASPRCQLDDAAFIQLFHSLRPRGWTPDGGKTLAGEIQGIWQNSQSAGIARFKFRNDGRYESGIATSATVGVLERTSASVADGGYRLSGDLLTVTPDRRDRSASKYRVRVYDSYFAGRWWRQMSLLDENANPPLDVRYDRIEN